MSSLQYLKGLPLTAGKKIGCIGFCAGGGNSFQLAVNGGKDISAAVVFYGTPATQAQIADQLTAPVLCLFEEQDRNFTGMLPGFITNALNARKSFETHVYQGANHGFHNDTGAAYNRDAACDAWAKTLAWYGKYFARALRMAKSRAPWSSTTRRMITIMLSTQTPAGFGALDNCTPPIRSRKLQIVNLVFGHVSHVGILPKHRSQSEKIFPNACNRQTTQDLNASPLTQSGRKFGAHPPS